MQPNSLSQGKQSVKMTVKRPLTAFNFFFKEERQKLYEDAVARASLQDESGVGDKSTVGKARQRSARRQKKAPIKLGIPFQDLIRMVSKKWKALDPEQKRKYEILAEEDKKRYRLDRQRVTNLKGLEAQQNDTTFFNPLSPSEGSPILSGDHLTRQQAFCQMQMCLPGSLSIPLPSERVTPLQSESSFESSMDDLFEMEEPLEVTFGGSSESKAAASPPPASATSRDHQSTYLRNLATIFQGMAAQHQSCAPLSNNTLLPPCNPPFQKVVTPQRVASNPPVFPTPSSQDLCPADGSTHLLKPFASFAQMVAAKLGTGELSSNEPGACTSTVSSFLGQKDMGVSMTIGDISMNVEEVSHDSGIGGSASTTSERTASLVDEETDYEVEDNDDFYDLILQMEESSGINSGETAITAPV